MSYRDNRNRSKSDNRNRSFKRSGNRSSGGFSSGPRQPAELHDVTCSKCGTETQVPFKPDGSRPVYCRDCYQQQKPRRY